MSLVIKCLSLDKDIGNDDLFDELIEVTEIKYEHEVFN